MDNPVILEQTLLNLTREQLLSSASEICHEWRDAIQTSPKVGKYLFKDVDVARDEDKEQFWDRNPVTEQ